MIAPLGRTAISITVVCTMLGMAAFDNPLLHFVHANVALQKFASLLGADIRSAARLKIAAIGAKHTLAIRVGMTALARTNIRPKRLAICEW